MSARQADSSTAREGHAFGCMAGTGTGTMTREVKRLETAGAVRARMVGRTKLVEADRTAPFCQACANCA
jgi:hypothetical protein